jgi:membrane fusion protein (multidrug efflux system)
MRRLMQSPRYRLYTILSIAAIVAGVFGTVHFVAAADSADAAASKTDAATKESEDQDEKAPIPVRVAEVKRGSVAAYLSATANLVPENEVTVLAEAEGRVAHLGVEEGDTVSAAEALAALIRDEAEIELQKARLRASNATMAYERAVSSFEQGLISREEFDRLQLEHEVAQQEVAEASWRLSKTTIRAPFAGRVTERMVSPGQHVRVGDELFRIADFDPLIAKLYLPEKDVLSLSVGRGVRLTLAADSSVQFTGTIRQISPVVDTATGTVKVTVEANEPPSDVRPGAFVSVAIVREQRSAAVLLPRESVLREVRSAHVFIAGDNDTAVRRPVTLGLEENGKVEALSGVQPGERVIVAGQGGLKEGTKIKVL